MAGDASFKWNDQTLRVNIKNFPSKLDKLIERTIDYWALRGEAHMKKTAPWTDRSSNARNSLHTVTIHEKNRHQIIFAHGMKYGIWLEIRFAGRYAVIMPSVRHVGPQVMSTLNKGMRKMGTGA